MTRLAGLCVASSLICVLTSCAAYQAHEARSVLPGTTVPDLLSCTAKPDAITQISDVDWLLYYHTGPSSAPAFSVKTLFGDLAIGSKGGCDLTVRVREPGYVIAVHYSGTEISTSGENAACAPLVRECSRFADRTRLPAGYSLARWLKNGAAK